MNLWRKIKLECKIFVVFRESNRDVEEIKMQTGDLISKLITILFLWKFSAATCTLLNEKLIAYYIQHSAITSLYTCTPFRSGTSLARLVKAPKCTSLKPYLCIILLTEFVHRFACVFGNHNFLGRDVFINLSALAWFTSRIEVDIIHLYITNIYYKWYPSRNIKSVLLREPWSRPY